MGKPEPTAASRAQKSNVQRIGEYRHTRMVRITHWINTISFLFLIPSGIAILIAHPELYWGETGYFGEPAVLTFPVEPNFNHTAWGRGMHFFFAWVLVINGLVYMVSGLLNGHFRRKLIPATSELRPGNFLQEIRAHMRPRLARRKPAMPYNVLQKVSYLVVVFVLFPLMLFTGLAMSPAMEAALPDVFAVFGGRQTARTLHFFAAGLLLLFFLVHILQVFLSGAVNQIRAMVTGHSLVNPEEDS